MNDTFLSFVSKTWNIFLKASVALNVTKLQEGISHWALTLSLVQIVLLQTSAMHGQT